MKEKVYHLGAVLAFVLLLCASFASAQQCTQAVLNTEFMTDPTQRAYSTCASDGNLAGTTTNDSCVLAKFNEPCTNNAACKVDNVLSREAIMETIIDSAELEKLATSTAPADVARKTQLGWLLQIATFNMAKAPNQQKWKNVFAAPAGASPITNAAINAAQLKDAPRSQIVCGRQATLDDVSCGLRGTSCP
jgi:hypothetical protein